MDKLSQYGPLVGRLLLAIPLLDFAIWKVNNWEMMIAWLDYKGFATPTLITIGSVVTELAGGLLLTLGLKVRWTSLWLIVYLVAVTGLVHDFWAVSEAARQSERESFGKGLMIIGGLLFVYAHGGGKLSMDNRLRESTASRDPHSREEPSYA